MSALGAEDRSWRVRGPKAAAFVVLAGLTFALPKWLNASDLTIYVLICLYAIVATGLSLLMGFAGQISIGQAAFYAVGAYTAAVLSLHGVPTVIALLAAPVLAGIVAMVVGIPILRLRGPYLAFATLALQLIVVSIIGEVPFLGASVGLYEIPKLSIGGAKLDSNLGYAWLGWLVLALVIIVSRNLIRSRQGRALRALATSEAAAEASGVAVGRYRLFVFAYAAAVAGLAGGIYASFLAYIAPSSFSVLLTVDFVVMAVVGGLGTPWGGVVGAASMTILLQWLDSVGTQPGMPVYMASVLSYAAYGVILALVITFFRDGIVPAVSSGLARLRERGRAPAASAAVGPEDPQQRTPADASAIGADG